MPRKDVHGKAEIAHALSRIESDKAETRHNAISEIRRAILLNRFGASSATLDDRSYHAILEHVFRIIRNDVAKLLRATAYTKARLSSRVSDCANLVRSVVEIGSTVFRRRTLRSVIDHITQCLRPSENEYCEPLAADYCKALAALLGHRAHVEHLSAIEWRDLVEFLVKYCENSNTINASQDSTGRETLPTRATPVAASMSSAAEDASGQVASTKSAMFSQLQNSVEDVMVCLHCLFSASNAPVLDSAKLVLEVIFALLHQYPHPGKIQHNCYDIIDVILSHTCFNDVEFTSLAIIDLLPIISSNWVNASHMQRESILAILLRSQAFFDHLFRDFEARDVEYNISRLLTQLEESNLSSVKTPRLLMEDIVLGDSSSRKSGSQPLRLKIASARADALNVEVPWCILHVSAALRISWYEYARTRPRVFEGEGSTVSSKRQKRMSPLDDILQRLRLGTPDKKIADLQLSAFILDQSNLSASVLCDFVENLMLQLSTNDASIVSWALFALLSLHAQVWTQEKTIEVQWTEIWRTVFRFLTNSATCGVACETLAAMLESGVVSYDSIAELTESMLSSTASEGPVTCGVSVHHFWSTIILLRQQRNVILDSYASMSIVRSIIRTWSPSRILNREHKKSIARMTSPESLIEIFFQLLGCTSPVDSVAPASYFGRLSHVQFAIDRGIELQRYLLDQHVNLQKPDLLAQRKKQYVPANVVATKEDYQALTQLLVDSIQQECTALRAALSNSDKLTSDDVHVIAQLLLSGYAVLNCGRVSTGQAALPLQELHGLQEDFLVILRRPGRGAELIKSLVDSVGYLVRSASLNAAKDDPVSKAVIAFSRSFNEACWMVLGEDFENPDSSGKEHESIEADMIFDSQKSRSSGTKIDVHVSHKADDLQASFEAYGASTKRKMIWLANSDTDAGPGKPACTTDPSTLITNLTNLTKEEFVLCFSAVKGFLAGEVTICIDDADTLLQYIQQVIVGSYEFQHSEVAAVIAMEVLTSFAALWTKREGHEIFVTGAELFSYFVKKLQACSLVSDIALDRAGQLVSEVLRLHPDYLCDSALPSTRTILLQILETGNHLVKFHMGTRVADLFDLFVFKEHDSIFDDIVNTLPQVTTRLEGIAVRIKILADLAISRSTILRRCIYAIFEIGGRIAQSFGYARTCLVQISNVLKLAAPRKLFTLFSRQLLYTWLNAESIGTIPFAIFGYDSLNDLLREHQEEIVAQVMMRGKERELTTLEKVLKQPIKDLIAAAVCKVAAYCMSRDIAIPPEDSQPPEAELRVRKILGKDRYNELVAQHLPSITGEIFLAIDKEHQIQRAFDKSSMFLGANDNYEEMSADGHSDIDLPTSQQPCFRSKYLLAQIKHLCNRSSIDPSQLWNQSLFVQTFRYITNTLHAALGSLHTCSIIKKIRILISVAGPVALKGYSIRMALHMLRPFAIDRQCAGDALGILKYLLKHGRNFLTEIPSFITGHGISTLLDLKVFLSSQQDQFTQDSAYKATLSKAAVYHEWIVSYLHSYSSRWFTEDQKSRYDKLITAAASLLQVNGHRPRADDTNLLFAFLEDRSTDDCLLSLGCQDLILTYLSQGSMENIQSYQDAFVVNGNVAKFAPTVVKTCRSSSARCSYLQWGARFIGRSYAEGMIDADSLAGEIASPFESFAKTETKTMSPSRIKILQLLIKLLDNEKGSDAGVAELALVYAVTKSHATSYEAECRSALDSYLYEAMLCQEYSIPQMRTWNSSMQEAKKLDNIHVPEQQVDGTYWIQDLVQALASVETEDPLILAVKGVVRQVRGFAEDALPFVLHLALLSDLEGSRATRASASEICQKLWDLSANRDLNNDLSKRLLEAFLYLRTQPLPHEVVSSDRLDWLEVDLRAAAVAAEKCAMFKTSLLLLELEQSQRARINVTARRRGADGLIRTDVPDSMLLRIFRNLDAEDAFFGIKQAPDIQTVLAQFENEQLNFKSLSFQSAIYDAHMRGNTATPTFEQRSIMQVLSTLNLDGLAHSLSHRSAHDPATLEATFNSARKLEKWDLTVSSPPVGTSSSIYACLRKIFNATERVHVSEALNLAFMECLNTGLHRSPTSKSAHSALSALTILTECEEILSVEGLESLHDLVTEFRKRDEILVKQRYNNIKEVPSCRQTILGTLSKQAGLRSLCRLSLRDVRLMECKVLLTSTLMARKHGALQDALNCVTFLTLLARKSDELGVYIQAASDFENAEVLWCHGEKDTAVRLLQKLHKNLTSQDFPSQDIKVGKPGLLARLGNYTAAARLEKPDIIIEHILKQAVRELGNTSSGEEAAEVFHEFAAFCDGQLHNADSLADFHRMKHLRDRKEAEVKDLDRMVKNAIQPRDQENLKSHRNKAQQWFDLDNNEYRRLESSREVLVIYSLENYLRSLRASDKYENDALRFSTLWLENCENAPANKVVGKYLPQVPSHSFAPLMTQWTSRLLDNKTTFQDLLFGIVLRVCVEHPYHGMYQIFASSKTKGGKDEMALSRHAAANKIVEELKKSVTAHKIWLAVHNMNVTFVRFAQERFDDGTVKPGLKIPLRKSQTGTRVEQDVLKMKVPPPTMNVSLRADRNYNHITTIERFLPEFTVATGISMPKITTAIGSDGNKYKQLFKSGNDDLRQDAIMEQVFGAVSTLLGAQRVTRQRRLKIRTYKVLPLTATAGVIEFVPNTVPLHDYLLPAHQRHYPKDLKPNACRKHIAEAQSKSNDQRIRQFQKVCEHFHPVLRHFFLEHYESPDQWYDKRLAYTKSTAAISILGHVLGLGDRHGHNILLDKGTGEVVHIDLGIAFEQGRVLPVPEVVPFRLTRDLVDGMGITGTEGVFRRCCEFTLQALRNEVDAIMSILDVLRYDPLYSWSLSPLRLKKMQEAQTEISAVPAERGEKGRTTTEEAGEADRALLVVRKKLSPTLSVQATVNELIQQATDEKNLAVLFCGWAAYA